MTRILVAEDEIVNRMIIEENLSGLDIEMDMVEDGEAAWEALQEKEYDLLVLDRLMPRLDGLTLLRRVKEDPRWRSTPVIMQTAASSQQEVLEGVQAGAFHYLTKPYEPTVLRMLVRTIVADIQDKARLSVARERLHATLGLFVRGEVQFRTLNEARSIAAAMASVCGDSAQTAEMGLLELLINAVEHGNLGITYKEKSELKLSGTWELEIERRLLVAPWLAKVASIAFERHADEVEFTITDQGAGFDWSNFLEIDPARVYDLHGRGIAMAKMLSFASVEYRGAGNVVVARVPLQASA